MDVTDDEKAWKELRLDFEDFDRVLFPGKEQQDQIEEHICQEMLNIQKDVLNVIVVCGMIPHHTCQDIRSKLYNRGDIELIYGSYISLDAFSHPCISVCETRYYIKKCVESKKHLIIYTSQMEVIECVIKLAYFNRMKLRFIHLDNNGKVECEKPSPHWTEKMFRCSNASIDFTDMLWNGKDNFTEDKEPNTANCWL